MSEENPKSPVAKRRRLLQQIPEFTARSQNILSLAASIQKTLDEISEVLNGAPQQLAAPVSQTGATNPNPLDDSDDEAHEAKDNKSGEYESPKTKFH